MPGYSTTATLWESWDNFTPKPSKLPSFRLTCCLGLRYKGIPLVSAIAIALAQSGHNFPFCFNRKEVKDHGEGGNLVGAPLTGRVLIVDDVISAGTSVRESVNHIHASGAVPCGLGIALDRMERGNGALSATQEVHYAYGIQVDQYCRS